ncbi:hypothetical protein [Burkholderia pseudomallei]|uniref:hypothetical protein n=1 Tax=Burkholderia pseudomallei TaxID=28450 RepID=UPI0011788818|nr:hypothetical protein [Burkholderia pseudomallei]
MNPTTTPARANLPTRKTHANPYEEGYTAARQGKEEWRNPYPYNSPEAGAWLAGYRRWATNYRTVR